MIVVEAHTFTYMQTDTHTYTFLDEERKRNIKRERKRERERERERDRQRNREKKKEKETEDRSVGVRRWSVSRFLPLALCSSDLLRPAVPRRGQQWERRPQENGSYTTLATGICEWRLTNEQMGQTAQAALLPTESG